MPYRTPLGYPFGPGEGRGEVFFGISEKCCIFATEFWTHCSCQQVVAQIFMLKMLNPCRAGCTKESRGAYSPHKKKDEL